MAADKRTLVELIRRADFNDAVTVFAAALDEAHAEGAISGMQRVLDKLEVDTSEMETGIHNLARRLRPNLPAVD